MKREDMLVDERYHINAERLKRFDETNGIVADWVRTLNRDDLLQLLDEYGVPVSPIYSIKDIFEDEHYQQRENIIEVEHPRLGTIKMPGVVPKFSETPGAVRNVGPDLGENNVEILEKLLNYSEEEIANLKNSKVI